MIYINIVGVTKKKAALVENAAIFAFKYLMPRLKKDVDVDIIFSNLKDVCGWQGETGDRQFEIELSKHLHGDDLLTSIFHEVTHCVQDLKGTKIGWDLPYNDRPFEIEAYQMQEKILKVWNETNKKI